MNDITHCPECSCPLIVYHTIVTDTLLPPFRYVEIEIACCTQCDWMTAVDWKRTEAPPVDVWA